MEYTCLLLTDFKNEFRLYIAYIGQKGTKEKKGMNIAFLMKGKQKVPTKEKNSIYTYRVRKEKRVKNGHKRAQKKGLFCSP